LVGTGEDMSVNNVAGLPRWPLVPASIREWHPAIFSEDVTVRHVPDGPRLFE
jgi:hypothetical protein